MPLRSCDNAALKEVLGVGRGEREGKNGTVQPLGTMTIIYDSTFRFF